MAPLLTWRNVDPTTSSAPVEVLLAEPALDPPPGVERHMSTKSWEQQWFVLGAVLCIVVPGFVLLLRIYTKIFIMRKSEVADIFIALGFPFLIVEAVMGHYMVKYGAGAHQWNVTRAELYNMLYWGNVAEIVYFPAIFMVKMSILLQYLRMFAPNRSLNKTMYYGAWVIIVLSFISYGTSMFWTIWYCQPRAMIWNKLTPGGRCHDHGPIVFSSSIYNVVSDIAILLLPVLSLWRLQIPVGRKIAVSALFATGLLACIASVMRIVFTIRIVPPIHISDVSYNSIWIGLWSEAELALGFVVACTLSLPKLIRSKKWNIGRVFSSFRAHDHSHVTKSSEWTSRSHSRTRERGYSGTGSTTLDLERAKSPQPKRDVIVEVDAVVEVDGVKGTEMRVLTREAVDPQPDTDFTQYNPHRSSLGVLPEFEDDHSDDLEFQRQSSRTRGLEVLRESGESDEFAEWQRHLERQQQQQQLELEILQLEREQERGLNKELMRREGVRRQGEQGEDTFYDHSP